MLLLLPALVTLCPPGNVCLQYPDDSNYQLQLDLDGMGCEEHIDVLSATIELEKVRANTAEQRLMQERMTFGRQRKIWIAMGTVMGSAIITMVVVAVELAQGNIGDS